MSLRRAGAAAAALAVLAVAGCGAPAPAAPETPAGTGAVPVVTSTNVYGSLVKAVGGDRVAVESLITDPAADPHSYESTPADATKVAAARVVVVNGGGYDDFLGRLVESAGTNATVVEVASLAGDEPADGHEHGAVNEHFWYSLPAMTTLVDRLAADLAAADPVGAATYTANAQTLSGKLAELTTKAAAIGAAAPGARVAVTEPVAGHLIEAAGLTDATPHEFAEAVEEDTEPPAAVLQETLALFGADPVRALVVNAQTETPTTDQVKQAAQTAGVPVVEVTETLPQGTPDYVTWMGAEIEALAGALR